ncbi:MAG: ABC transporter ATP-binding protein [Caldilineaceae bacterium]
MATLSLLNLTKRFGDVTAVNDITLKVADGEFLSMLGPSGCGKSTALRMIAGFEDPTSGDVQIDGDSVVHLPPNRRPTAMVFQKFTLWPHMRIYDNIAFGLRLRNMSKSEVDREVNSALELVGLPHYGTRFPAQLSGGEQQRVALARALVLKPKILLLDEPFSNLDALLRVRLREEVRSIQRNVKITTIFVTHDQEEALSIADRIAVMSRGKIEQLDKPSTIYALPQSRFVADFIGTMNMLDADVQADAIFAGQNRLPAPNNLTGKQVTLAIRPEDITLVKGVNTAESLNGVRPWQGQITQVSDLGHYRKVFVNVPSTGVIKVYLPKAIEVEEGNSVELLPTRYLVYAQEAAPVEVNLKTMLVAA